MRAVVLTAPNTIVAVERPEPDQSTGAVVQLERAGICGTDVKILHGDIPVAVPRVMGHEFVGRIVREGPAVRHRIGARVLVDPAISDGTCRQCRAGRPNLCPNGALLGREVDGVFSERVVVDERRLHPVPDAIGADAAGSLQVLGTCVHAQAQLGSAVPKDGVVIGLGVAGLLHVQLLRALGVATIVGVARSAHKRDIALVTGATSVAAPDDAEAAVREATDGEGAELVIEAVGTVRTLAQAIRMAAPGGTVVVFGTITSSEAGDLPFYQLYFKELRVLDPRAALPQDYDRAIDLVASGQVDPTPLAWRSFPLGEAAMAMREVTSGRGALKVTLHG
jgi:L-iditol 2-dehydrogenase